ncbi:hypothetical protein [Bacillus sp. TH12]|uniref:hypothetical protein n=1 Tax=Bacillus sp. TH12 TaxID=2796378 RepID=UPI00191182EF|nr:hypothetical protein [Bacillus sp. TH12]MBK5505859.1 hypothetical protein [Bacillus sp. TH12]
MKKKKEERRKKKEERRKKKEERRKKKEERRRRCHTHGDAYFYESKKSVGGEGR